MRKVADIFDQGIRLVIQHDGTGATPYKVSRMWFDKGWHRRQVTKCTDLITALNAVHWYYCKALKGEDPERDFG